MAGYHDKKPFVGIQYAQFCGLARVTHHISSIHQGVELFTLYQLAHQSQLHFSSNCAQNQRSLQE